MNNRARSTREAKDVLRRVLQGELGFELNVQQVESRDDSRYDFVVEAKSGRARFRFGVKVVSRITPQVALATFQAMRPQPKKRVPVLYAPVVSPRVAEIARSHGVSFIDQAGNCRLEDRDHCILVERRGFQNERRPTPPAADPFSTKSSRIVRALLSGGVEGWRTRALAAHPDVDVSAGLVVKVKRALIEEGYAVEHEKRLYLRDPVALLNAWAASYSGPNEEVAIYLRGDPAASERSVSQWCEGHGLRYALAGFSAAWRLAPEVRYSVAAAYVEDRAFEPAMLAKFEHEQGAKRVETGANLLLWRPSDAMVFAWSGPFDSAPSVTSDVQTFLDLNRMAGRAKDAAEAVYKKCLAQRLGAAAKHAEVLAHAV